MPAFLVPVDRGHCLIPLEKAIVLIGRQADCDVSLTLSRKISRKHCCIAQVNNSFVVRDLGSTNGVFLNGNRVQKEATIAMGDDLVIGDVQFRLQNEATAPSKKKTAGNGAAPEKASDKPAEKKAGGPAVRPLKPTLEAPPSMDIPIALPEGDLDFAVEVTNIKQQPVSRKDRIDDVIPLRDDELDEDDEPMRLASDSNLNL